MAPPTPEPAPDASHGDRPLHHPNPARPASPTAQSIHQTPDPDASPDDLLPHQPLGSNRPTDEEIGAMFDTPPASLPELPTNGGATTTTGAATTPSTTATTTSWQHKAPLPQVITAATVLLPDFAMELQRQEDLRAPASDPGLKVPSSGIEDDPLTCDIIKRLSNQEIQHNPSAIMEATVPHNSVTRTEKPKFTREEKGKAIRFSDAQGQLPQGHKPTTSSFKECNGARRRTELLQGECSRVRAAGSNSSFQPAATQGSKECRQQHENLNRRQLARSQQDNIKDMQQMDDGFQRVKPAYWWRKEGMHSRDTERVQQPEADLRRRERYRAHVRGKCLNCFSTEHRVAECRYRSKCWKCLQWGHKAHSCPAWRDQYKHPEQQRRHHQTPAAQLPPSPSRPTEPRRSDGRSYLQVAKGELVEMATYPGDPRARPDLAACAIAATGSIKRKRDELISKVAVCWLNVNSQDIGTHHVVDALEEELRINRHEFKVVKHFPEQYLVLFNDSRACRHVLHRREVRSRGRVFYFDEWTEHRGAAASSLEYRVRLRIEGVPVHAWSEAVAAKVIGPTCAIQFVEGYSRRRDRTRTYDLWAWSSNPSKIPKKVILTITDPDREVSGNDDDVHHRDLPQGRKRGLEYKLHLHLDVVEDLSFHGGPGSGTGNRKPRREFLWNYGAPDSRGERRSGQRHNNHADRDYRPRRDRDDHDDDNFNHGVRGHRSQSSWGRMTRCRGMVDDCYSTTTCYRGDNHRQGGYRSRAARQREAHWRPKSKKVSFANPLISFMGPSTKDQRILHLLKNAPGWTHVDSPRCEANNLMVQASSTTTTEVCMTEPAFLVSSVSDHQYPSSRVVLDVVPEPSETTNTQYLAFANTAENNLDKVVNTQAQAEPAVENPDIFVESVTNDAENMAAFVGSVEFVIDEVDNSHAQFEPTVQEPTLVSEAVMKDSQLGSFAAASDPFTEQIREPTLSQSSAFTTDSNSFATLETHRDQAPEPVLQRQLEAPNGHIANPSLQQTTSPEPEHTDDLTLFLNFVSGPPNRPLLHTPPKANQQPAKTQAPPAIETTTQQRKISRLADKAKANPGKGSIQLAQQVLINKLGDLVPDPQQKHDSTLDSLVHRLPRPFTKHTMEALQVLVEERNKPKSRKKSKVAPSPVMEQLTPVV
ncbi:unnamed protein product [Urochloa humidicola]